MTTFSLVHALLACRCCASVGALFFKKYILQGSIATHFG